jgi:hypothetical protein
MNPITAIGKLLKSKPILGKIEVEVHGMNKTNWKTTIVGIITCGLALAQIWLPKEYQERINGTAIALAGAGLIASKDHDN